MELVAVEQHFNEEKFTHFTVWVTTDRKTLESVEGVTKAKSRGNDTWEVHLDRRFYPGGVETNIYAAFPNGAAQETTS